MEAIAQLYPGRGKTGRLTRQRVRQILLRNGLSGGSSRVDPLKVLRLVSECDSTKAIAKRLPGVGYAAVARVLHTLSPTAVDEMTAYRHEDTRTRAITRLRALAEKLGRTPTKVDLDKRGPHPTVLQYIFGSLTEAHRAAGLEPNNKAHPHLTPAKRLEVAMRFKRTLGGTNAKELAEEYGMTVGGIHAIVKSFKLKGHKCAA